MTYTKFHDPWGSGSCCGVPDIGQPNTPITKAALNAHEQGIFDAHTLNAAAPTDEMQSSRVTGDAERRYQQLADGTLNWGGGTLAPDVSLFRPAAGILTNTGSFIADSYIANGTSATDNGFTAQVNGDAAPRWTLTDDGHQYWGDGTNPYDTDLFRSSAGVLRTGSQFSINKIGTATDAELRLSRDVGHLANIRMRTGLLDRWGIQTSNDAEGGANAGSNLNFQRFDDAGVLIGNVMNMTRSTGVVMITNPGLANGAVVSVDGAQSLTNKVYQGSGTPSSTINMSMKVTGDTALRWTLNLNGDMSWSPGAGAQDAFLKRSAPGVLQGTDTSFQSQRAATGLLGFQALVSGDTNPRWQVTAGGTVSLGPGNAAVDWSMARVSNNVASISGVLQYTGSSGTGGFSTFINADTVARVAVLNNGILFGPGNAAGDASLVRIGVAILGTQGFQASGAISAAGGYASTRAAASSTYVSRVTGDTNDRWSVTSSGVMGFGPGNAAVDVTFTRSAAAELTMVGALRLNGNVGFYNTAPVAKPTVTGSRGGNAALASLLTALAGQGLLTDSSTA